MDDLLGFERFEQHRDWSCSGRIEGDYDEIEPTPYAVERHGDRWLLATGSGDLVAVGDLTRDLVARNGGLEREPSGLGLRPYSARTWPNRSDLSAGSGPPPAR